MTGVGRGYIRHHTPMCMKGGGRLAWLSKHGSVGCDSGTDPMARDLCRDCKILSLVG